MSWDNNYNPLDNTRDLVDFAHKTTQLSHARDAAKTRELLAEQVRLQKEALELEKKKLALEEAKLKQGQMGQQVNRQMGQQAHSPPSSTSSHLSSTRLLPAGKNNSWDWSVIECEKDRAKKIQMLHEYEEKYGESELVTNMLRKFGE